jgi:hypothetical protein
MAKKLLTVLFSVLLLSGSSMAFAIDVPMRSNRVVTTTQTTTVTTYADGSDIIGQGAPFGAEPTYLSMPHAQSNVGGAVAIGALVGLTAGVAMANAQQNYYHPWYPQFYRPFFPRFRPWGPYRPGPRPFWPGPYHPYGPYWAPHAVHHRVVVVHPRYGARRSMPPALHRAGPALSHRYPIRGRSPGGHRWAHPRMGGHHQMRGFH